MSSITIITGGSRGLGKSMALHLAERGHDVIITYRQQQAEADAVVAAIQAKGRNAAALQLDVSAFASYPAFVEAVHGALRGFGAERFDNLVNNAGAGLHALFTDTTEAQFDDIINQHLKAPFFLTQKLLPLINDGGRILNVSSGLTRMTHPGASVYASAKTAVETLTRYLAKELGPRKISVNVIAPGAIATDFNGGRVRDNAQLNAQIAQFTALGRVGEADDIGGAVAALLDPGAGWINGQRVEASGGQGL